MRNIRLSMVLMTFLFCQSVAIGQEEEIIKTDTIGKIIVVWNNNNLRGITITIQNPDKSGDEYKPTPGINQESIYLYSSKNIDPRWRSLSYELAKQISDSSAQRLLSLENDKSLAIRFNLNKYGNVCNSCIYILHSKDINAITSTDAVNVLSYLQNIKFESLMNYKLYWFTFTFPITKDILYRSHEKI